MRRLQESLADFSGVSEMSDFERCLDFARHDKRLVGQALRLQATDAVALQLVRYATLAQRFVYFLACQRHAFGAAFNPWF